MQLIRWRSKNGLSVRKAASLFALSPGQLSLIERGLQFPRASIALRIMAVTMAMGPEVVTGIDLLDEWHRAHPQESKAIRAAGHAAAMAHLNVAKEQAHGKRQKGKG